MGWCKYSSAHQNYQCISCIQTTQQRVSKLFAWAGLRRDIESFVKQCTVCQQAKHENCKSSGLLSHLPVPEGPWRDISMDFIEGLPKSEGYSIILVVVDCFTKYAHFISLKHPFTTAFVALSFLNNVVKLHGVPHSIVSDRDKVFTSSLWRELFKLLKTEPQTSSAYHPQTDRQTE